MNFYSFPLLHNVKWIYFSFNSLSCGRTRRSDWGLKMKWQLSRSIGFGFGLIWKCVVVFSPDEELDHWETNWTWKKSRASRCMEVSPSFISIAIQFNWNWQFFVSFSRIKHILNMEPGNWTVRVKAKNTEGWSTYSTEEAILVPVSGKQSLNDAITSFYFMVRAHWMIFFSLSSSILAQAPHQKRI